MRPEMNGISHIEGMSHLFLGMSLTLGLMHLFRGLKPMKILGFSDKYSYSIYIVHQLFILSPFTLMAITHNVVANIIIVLMFITMFGVILQKSATTIDNQVSKYIKF